jgi:hypothetical protein
LDCGCRVSLQSTETRSPSFAKDYSSNLVKSTDFTPQFTPNYFFSVIELRPDLDG